MPACKLLEGTCLSHLPACQPLHISLRSLSTAFAPQFLVLGTALVPKALPLAAAQFAGSVSAALG
eukprot:7337031-Alexandrium_andersonii.AAC.1